MVMKKVISIITIVSMFFSMLMLPSNAMASESYYDVEAFYTEENAADIALIFVYKNIQSGNEEWTLDTKVGRIYPIYDIDSSIMSYVICLETDGQDSGYVVVSARQDHMPIMEYAFSGKPVFEEQMKEKELESFRSYN